VSVASRHIIRAAALLTGLELLSHAAGLVKQILIAARFGTSQDTDEFVVALAVATLLASWVGLPIRQTVIPMFRHDLAQLGERAAWKHLSLVLNNTTVLLVVGAVVLEAAAPLFVDIVAPGFSRASEGRATVLTRILLFTVLITGVQSLVSQILFSYSRFALPGIAAVLDHLVVIGALLIAGRALGIEGLAIAVVVGAFVELIIQVPGLWPERRLWVARLSFRDPRTIEMGRLSLPLLVTAGGGEVSRVTDRMFASMLPAGRLSALAFAHRLYASLNSVLFEAVQQATFPHFSQLTAEGEFSRLSRALFRCLRLMMAIAVPVAVGTALLADLIVRVAYRRGEFDDTSAMLTGVALVCYAIGLPALAGGRLLSRTFFGLKDTSTPSKISLLRIGFKVALCLLLVGPLGHAGIALADSASEMMKTVLLFVMLPAHIKRGEGRETVRALMRTAFASSAMALAVYGARHLLDGRLTGPIELVTLAALGTFVYAAIVAAGRTEERESLAHVVNVVGGRLWPRRWRAA
jgi:putative peptidoglycan lipid II flippase